MKSSGSEHTPFLCMPIASCETLSPNLRKEKNVVLLKYLGEMDSTQSVR